LTSPESRVRELGLQIPDYADPPYGVRYGAGLKAFHRIGEFVEFSGLTPENRAGEQQHPGVVGVEVTIEEARAAARLTAINSLGMIRYAIGSLDNVAALSRALCFVLTAPGFTELNEVSNAATELYVDVFGPEVGAVGRASIGAVSLTRSNCFELWLSLECTPDAPRR
jgi:hypothetical protein